MKEKKMPKEVSKEIINKIWKNIVKAIGVIIYYMVLNMAYHSIKSERLIEDIKVFAGSYLLLGLVMLEKSYKEDNESIFLTGIELFVLAFHSMSIMHVTTMFGYDFQIYLLVSSYIFAAYYILKAIIICTKEKRKYLKGLSDISEIVKKDEPQKKEAKKKN